MSSMAQPTYLYGYGRKRHIADGDLGTNWRGDPASHGKAFCGTWGDVDKAKHEELRRWAWKAEDADRRMERQRGLPVCKPCQTAWDKSQES